ncbi:MAG TPA: hypothetical protein VH164_15285, partial [Ktedonobacteraceae bacterium]|nr:hypothetical protein [Ktedonobacteraceae bacterium]
DYNAPTEPMARIVLPPPTPLSPSPHRSPIPGLVRAGFALVQVVLLARVVCLVLNVQETTSWLVLLFTASDQLVGPIRWLAVTLNLSRLANTPLLTDQLVGLVRWLAATFNLSWLAGSPLRSHLEFVVAIPAYGLLSWLLVRLLRVVLNH